MHFSHVINRYKVIKIFNKINSYFYLISVQNECLKISQCVALRTQKEI